MHGCTYGMVLRGARNTFSYLHVDQNSVGIDSNGDENDFHGNFFGSNDQGAVVLGNRNRVTLSVFARNGSALTVGFGTENRVSASVFLRNEGGLNDQGGRDDAIRGNVFSDNRGFGVFVSDGAAGVRIEGNSITATRRVDDLSGGIILVNSSGNFVRANRVVDNATAGVSSFNESGDTIAGNTILDNTIGVRLGTGPRARVAFNTSLRNSVFDMQDDMPNCDANSGQPTTSRPRTSRFASTKQRGSTS